MKTNDQRTGESALLVEGVSGAKNAETGKTIESYNSLKLWTNAGHKVICFNPWTLATKVVDGSKIGKEN